MRQASIIVFSLFFGAVFSGCGNDVAVVGPQEGTVGSGDVTSTADSAVDPTRPSDAKTVTMGCGDGVCDGAESAAFCPQDCDPGAALINYCYAKECPEQLQACLADTQCPSFLVCSATGEKASTCLQQTKPAVGGTTDATLELVQCGNLACFGFAGPAPGQCGDGVCSVGEKKDCQKDCKPPEVAACGDSFCQSPSETRDSCPEDCWDGPGFQSCMETKCPGPLAQCNKVNACAKSLACAAQCTSNVCVTACIQRSPAAWSYAGPIGSCPFQKGCFAPDISSSGIKDVLCGDGICSEGESNAFCSKDCEKTDDTCGNGVCDSGETSQTCAKDCPSGDGGACIQQKCGAQLATCTADLDCLAVLYFGNYASCLETYGCQDAICVQVNCATPQQNCAGLSQCTTILSCYQQATSQQEAEACLGAGLKNYIPLLDCAQEKCPF